MTRDRSVELVEAAAAIYTGASSCLALYVAIKDRPDFDAGASVLLSGLGFVLLLIEGVGVNIGWLAAVFKESVERPRGRQEREDRRDALAHLMVFGFLKASLGNLAVAFRRAYRGGGKRIRDLAYLVVCSPTVMGGLAFVALGLLGGLAAVLFAAACVRARHFCVDPGRNRVVPATQEVTDLEDLATPIPTLDSNMQQHQPRPSAPEPTPTPPMYALDYQPEYQPYDLPPLPPPVVRTPIPTAPPPTPDPQETRETEHPSPASFDPS